MKITARELFMMTIEEVEALGSVQTTIVYDDGTEQLSKARARLYTRLYWELFKGYEQTPILPHHHVNNVLNGGTLNSKTNKSLTQNIIRDIIKTYKLITPESKVNVWKRISEVNTAAYNYLIARTQGSESSIDVMDFIEIVKHPKMLKIKEEMLPEPRSIAHAYEQGLALMNDPTEFKDNGVTKAVRAGMVRVNQLLQCVVARGIPLEVTGDLFKTAIVSNYVLGLNSLYSFATESRSAAKSQFLSEAPIQDAEYFARRLQLLTMTITSVSYTDCNTDRLLKWRIDPPDYNEEGTEIYPGDLKFMKGKHYYMEGSDELLTIDGSETHLYGKTIYIRTLLYCKEPNPHKVCYRCLGEMHHNLPKHYNLGHTSAATMTRQSTQMTLSSRHHIGSGETDAIVISGLATAYVQPNKARSGFMLRERALAMEPRLILRMDECMGLNDINNVGDIEEINPRRISRIEYVELTLKENGKDITIPIKVAHANRKGFMTTGFLRYLKKHKWTVDERGNFVLPMSKWDNKVAFIELPDMEYSYSDHSNQVAMLIQSNIKDITERNQKGGPEKVLQDLFMLVNTKLFVNIAALEVIVYANTVKEEGSFGLSRGSPDPKMAVADQLIRNRSLGPAYAYQYVKQTIITPRNFFKLDRPDSPMDVFITPREVVENMR